MRNVRILVIWDRAVELLTCHFASSLCKNPNLRNFWNSFIFLQAGLARSLVMDYSDNEWHQGNVVKLMLLNVAIIRRSYL